MCILVFCKFLCVLFIILLQVLPFSLVSLADLLPWLAVLLPDLADLLSKYWKVLGWCFLYSVYVYLALLKHLQIQQWNDFPVWVPQYAWKLGSYNICEKNNNNCALYFCKVLVSCLQVLTWTYYFWNEDMWK